MMAPKFRKGAGDGLRRALLVLLLVLPSSVFVGQKSPALAAPPHRAFVQKNCVMCHNDTARTAGLSLSGTDLDKIGANAELWEKVLHKIRTGQMPPATRPRPDATEAKTVVTYLETELDRAAAAH